MKNFFLLLLFININFLVFSMEKHALSRYKQRQNIFTQEEYKEFLMIQRISALFYEYKNKYDLFECDPKFTLEPSQNRTKSGCFLELLYDLPFALWTSFGMVKFRSYWQVRKDILSHINEQCTNKFLADLGAELYKPAKISKDFDTVGPVYKITKVKDNFLSYPVVEVTEKMNSEDRKAMKQKWKGMKKKFKQEN